MLRINADFPTFYLPNPLNPRYPRSILFLVKCGKKLLKTLIAPQETDSCAAASAVISRWRLKL